MPEIVEANGMTQNTKHIVVLFLAGALISLILLAASLSNLQLLPGAPFPSSDNSDNAPPPISALPPVQTYSSPIQRGIIALIFLVLMIYVPARLITLVNIKIILRLILAIAILIIIGYMLPRLSPGQPVYFPGESFETTSPPSRYPDTPLGGPPQLLIWLVIIGIVLGIGLFAIKVWKRWPNQNKMEDQLLQEAEIALDALHAGMDLRNVIIRCYLQMAHSLQVDQGIERNHNMTAREFQDWLELKGFPTIPVGQLTGLFEKVRYGKQQISNNDEKIAIESLNEIIQYCRSERD